MCSKCPRIRYIIVRKNITSWTFFILVFNCSLITKFIITFRKCDYKNLFHHVCALADFMKLD